MACRFATVPDACRGNYAHEIERTDALIPRRLSRRFLSFLFLSLSLSLSLFSFEYVEPRVRERRANKLDSSDTLYTIVSADTCLESAHATWRGTASCIVFAFTTREARLGSRIRLVRRRYKRQTLFADYNLYSDNEGS